MNKLEEEMKLIRADMERQELEDQERDKFRRERREMVKPEKISSISPMKKLMDEIEMIKEMEREERQNDENDGKEKHTEEETTATRTLSFGNGKSDDPPRTPEKRDTKKNGANMTEASPSLTETSKFFFSPVRENYDEDEMRAIAESLAPAVSEMLNEEAFENLLSSHTSASPNPKGRYLENKKDESKEEEDGGDDDMSCEWGRLTAYEESLRDELALASGSIGNIMGLESSASAFVNNKKGNSEPPSSLKMRRDVDSPPESRNLIDEMEEEDEPDSTPSTPPTMTMLKTTPMHQQSQTHSQSSAPAHDFGIRLYASDAKFYTAPLPNSYLHNPQDPHHSISSLSPSLPPSYSHTPSPAPKHPSHQTSPAARSALYKCHREYLRPPPHSKLKKMFIGLSDSPVPSLRTATIQIRPDVLCGAVMDAASHAVELLGGSLQKRQGGHLKALLPPCRKRSEGWNLFGTDRREHAGFLPPVGVDVQICTKRKSRECEWVLLLQVHRVEGDDEGVADMMARPPENCEEGEGDTVAQAGKFLLYTLGDRHDKEEEREAGGWAEALVSPLKILMNEPSEEGPSKMVKDYPCLSEEDSPVVQSGWRIITEIIKEMESRDLAYCTLATTQFGAFPSLSTLDVHYCSQLRLRCRENMVASLLKTANELESFAREAEYSCANLIQLLNPTFELYGIQAPALPKSVPLTAYPLDFSPSEESHPPWGRHVMTALNSVSSNNSSGYYIPNHTDGSFAANTADPPPACGFANAQNSVRSVISAFQRQDDEEQGARLGRKNVQVVDRLAKMQAHKRKSVILLRDTYGRNEAATERALRFDSKARSAEAPHARSSPHAVSDRVPLLECPILLGSLGGGYTGTTGTCHVTARQIMVDVKSIPIIGEFLMGTKNRSHLLDLRHAEVEVWDPSPSFNKDMPAGITVSNILGETREEIISFVPMIGAKRFKSFVDMVRDVDMEDPETLKFSSRGGLLYMFDDNESPGGGGETPQGGEVAKSKSFFSLLTGT